MFYVVSVVPSDTQIVVAHTSTCLSASSMIWPVSNRYLYHYLLMTSEIFELSSWYVDAYITYYHVSNNIVTCTYSIDNMLCLYSMYAYV